MSPLAVHEKTELFKKTKQKNPLSFSPLYSRRKVQLWSYTSPLCTVICHQQQCSIFSRIQLNRLQHKSQIVQHFVNKQKCVQFVKDCTGICFMKLGLTGREESIQNTTKKIITCILKSSKN